MRRDLLVFAMARGYAQPPAGTSRWPPASPPPLPRRGVGVVPSAVIFSRCSTRTKISWEGARHAACAVATPVSLHPHRGDSIIMILRLRRPAQAFGLSLALLAASLVAITTARAHDAAKYPDWSGVWRGTGGNKWPTPAPLTAEYQAIFEANLRDQEAGGHGDTPTVLCLPPGMPRQMNVYDAMQIV